MRMLLAICALGALSFSLSVLAAGEYVWALDLTTFFWPTVILAAVGLLALSLLLGGTAARLASLVVVAACAAPFVLLPPRPDDAPGERIRLLSANLYVENPDPAPFVALLTREQPDIVVTQETRPHFVQAIRGAGIYPFENADPLYSTDDKKVFSRYPIREQSQLDDLPGRRTGRHAMRLVIESPAGPVVLYAVHPDTPRSVSQWHERNAYIERLAAALRDEPDDAMVVVAGDWNLPAYSPYFRQFFADTGYRFASPGFWLPVTRFAPRLARWGYFGSTIDHVAVSPNVRVTKWKRGRDIGSNHLPVIADLALPSVSALARR